MQLNGDTSLLVNLEIRRSKFTYKFAVKNVLFLFIIVSLIKKAPSRLLSSFIENTSSVLNENLQAFELFNIITNKLLIVRCQYTM